MQRWYTTDEMLLAPAHAVCIDGECAVRSKFFDAAPVRAPALNSATKVTSHDLKLGQSNG